MNRWEWPEFWITLCIISVAAMGSLLTWHSIDSNHRGWMRHQIIVQRVQEARMKACANDQNPGQCIVATSGWNNQ